MRRAQLDKQMRRTRCILWRQGYDFRFGAAYIGQGLPIDAVPQFATIPMESNLMPGKQ